MALNRVAILYTLNTCMMADNATASKKWKGKAKAKTPFTIKQRREMLLNFEAEDYGDLVTAAIDSLESGLHQTRYRSREVFVKAICHDPVRPTFVQFIMEMVAIRRYISYMKGKRFAVFEQRWFAHMHEYIETPKKWVDRTLLSPLSPPKNAKWVDRTLLSPLSPPKNAKWVDRTLLSPLSPPNNYVRFFFPLHVCFLRLAQSCSRCVFNYCDVGGNNRNE